MLLVVLVQVGGLQDMHAHFPFETACVLLAHPEEVFFFITEYLCLYVCSTSAIATKLIHTIAQSTPELLLSNSHT